MFNRNDHDGKGRGFLEFLLNVSNSVAKAWRSIGQESLHSVTRYNDEAYVYLCFLQAISKMDDIPYEQIASSRDLDLHTNLRNEVHVIATLLAPVDSSSSDLGPAAGLCESMIDSFADYRSAVGLCSFF